MKKPPMPTAGNAPRRGPAVRIPMSDCLGEYSEQRVIYGPTVATPELHNKPGDNPDGVGGGRWRMKETELSVEAPDSKWAFAGVPYVDLVQDDRGSAAWNRLGASDMFRITLSSPNAIKAKIATGSRSIQVRLACLARFYP